MRVRSFLLIALAAAGVGVVALEFAARSAAVELARSLEPAATLSFASAGIALDGSIRLKQPRLVINRGIWRGSAQARVADLRGGSALWLVSHSLLAEAGLPARLTVHTRGFRLGDDASGMSLSGWFGASDLALFENLACGSDALTDKDRQRMGVETREREDVFDYTYNAAAKSLGISMELHSADIADITGSAQLTGFDAQYWQQASSLAQMRIARAGLSYRDSGYFARRNQFCAQWLGVSSSEFVERHIAALEAFLGARGIEPGKDVVSLYQRLVTRGGTLSLTSLPDSSWSPTEISAYPREDLLRLLNITARLEDAPPIMLRLSFSDPEAPFSVASVVDPPLTTASELQPASGAEASLVLDADIKGFDHAEQLPATPALLAAEASEDVSTTPSQQPASPVEDSTEPTARSDEPRTHVVASAPPPPENSTLALVWKPGVIERLPKEAEREKGYIVVDKGRLSEFKGTRIQFVSVNGKWVDGEIVSVAGDTLVLRVPVSRGKAELRVPLSRIKEVRLLDVGSERR